MTEGLRDLKGGPQGCFLPVGIGLIPLILLPREQEKVCEPKRARNRDYYLEARPGFQLRIDYDRRRSHLGGKKVNPGDPVEGNSATGGPQSYVCIVTQTSDSGLAILLKLVPWPLLRRKLF